MSVAHYLGEWRTGTYTTTISAYGRSYNNRESPRQRCLRSEPRITAYCTVHTRKQYRDNTSADLHMHLYTYELFFLGDEYRWTITGKDNSYVSSHLLNVTTSQQFNLESTFGTLLWRNELTSWTNYRNKTILDSHLCTYESFWFHDAKNCNHAQVGFSTRCKLLTHCENLCLKMYELFYLADVNRWTITGKDNSYVSSHLLNVTTSWQFNLESTYGTLLPKNELTSQTTYRNNIIVDSHFCISEVS